MEIKQTQMITGIILAGGHSSRMGQDKAELPLKNGTLLDEMIRKLQQLGIDDIIVSNHESTTRYVADEFLGCGPLGGIHACMKLAHYPSCLIISVDVPLIPVDTLKDIIMRHQKAQTDATILIHDEQIEPLIGVYNTSILSIVTSMLENGHYAVRELLRLIDYQTLEYTDNDIFLTNCNTPEDYQLIISTLSKD